VRTSSERHNLRVRNGLAWAAVLLLAVACFAPWTEVTTFRGESIVVGAMNDYSGGARLILVCAAGAALGPLVRATRLIRMSRSWQ
jgi:hypothetical protein